MPTFFETAKRSFKDVNCDDGINTTEFLEAAEAVVSLFSTCPGRKKRKRKGKRKRKRKRRKEEKKERKKERKKEIPLSCIFPLIVYRPPLSSVQAGPA